jgi:FkbM family methyltransferase
MNKLIKKLLNVFGYRLISGHDYDKLVYSGKFRPQTRPMDVLTAIDLKKSLLISEDKPVIFDVGAYIGQTVSDYLASFPGARIYAFEPTPVSFAQLKNRFNVNEQVKCENLAISDTSGHIPFHFNEFSPTNSLLSSDEDADKYWGHELLKTVETVTVQSMPLDEICHRENINHIDILKLDVQGAELNVLHGAKNLLDTKRISIIYLEVIYVPTYNNQAVHFEIEQFLSDKGYALYGLFNLTYDKRLKQADMLFYLE